jgi:hypothetical protein
LAAGLVEDDFGDGAGNTVDAGAGDNDVRITEFCPSIKFGVLQDKPSEPTFSRGVLAIERLKSRYGISVLIKIRQYPVKYCAEPTDLAV